MRSAIMTPPVGGLILPRSPGGSFECGAALEARVLLVVMQEDLAAKFFFCVSKKKENGQPKGGMGGRHAATTQGF